MKFVTTLFLILLTSCSKEIAVNSAPISSPGEGRKAMAVLETSTQYDEPAIHSATASAILSGLALSSASAERCWQMEAKRRNIAMDCALSWSMGRERSTMLEQALASLAPTSRVAALAAIRAEFPLERIGLGDLQALLLLLNADPIWLKARAAKIWLRTHQVPPIAEANEIAKLIVAGKPTVPADFRDSYEVLRDLKPAVAASMLNDHCGPLIANDLQVRCWRFLSVFLEKPPSRRLSPELESRMPAHGRSWQLFQIGMPARARLFSN
jgi:hypothetical protein